jgi:hypothetical protein
MQISQALAEGKLECKVRMEKLGSRSKCAFVKGKINRPIKVWAWDPSQESCSTLRSAGMTVVQFKCGCSVEIYPCCCEKI